MKSSGEILEDGMDAAANWLLHSGIQNMDPNSPAYGSFHAWYDLNKKAFSFSYTEITGYGITTLLYLYSLRKDPLLLKRAKIAANWLIKRAFDPTERAVLCRMEQGQNTLLQKACTFDNGMCLNGIVNLYRETNNGGYREFAITLANWLLSMQKEDGSFYTRHLIPTDEYEEKGDKWSKQSGSFHAKLAIGLINLGLAINEERYIGSAEKICDFAMNLQASEGRFITESETNATFLHPCCYTAEGLITAGFLMGKEKYIESVKKCAEWVKENQLKTNGFSSHFVSGSSIEKESPDINAQVLRILILLNQAGEMDTENDTIKKAIQNILSYQCKDRRKEAFGGITSGEAWFYGEKGNHAGSHVNSWVTMFCIQAMGMALHPLKDPRGFVRYLV